MLLCGLALSAGCAEEPRPRTVTEFLDDPIVLEAAMVRCSQNRAESRYDAECVNARQAASIIAAKEERARREAFDAQSNRKREALRRTQQAAAEARRRAAEAERRRKEAEYLAQFGELPPTEDGAAAGDPAANAPFAVIPEGSEEPNQSPPPLDDATLASDGGNAPAMETPPPGDLGAIRDELRKRNEESAN